MKKVAVFIICIVIMSVFLSEYGKASENNDTNSQTNGSVNVQRNEMKQSTDKLNDVAEKFSDGIDFGKYYEAEAGTDLTPIQWKIIGEKDGYVLLLSKKIIDAKPFNITRTNTAWENSTIRKWMNNDFYHMAFSESEKQSMKSGTEFGDFVFLLSIKEVERYLSAESSRTASPTPFAIKHGVYINKLGESAWWLRSPVQKENETSYVSSWGSFGNRTHYVDEGVIGVRPAILVERSYFKSKSGR